MTKAANNTAKAGKGVTLEGMAKSRYQAAMDKLTQIKKDTGDGNALDHCKSLRGQGMLELALKLKVDRGASFIISTE